MTYRGQYTPYPPAAASAGRHHHPPDTAPRPVSGQPASNAQPDTDAGEELVVEMRNQVVDRLRLMSARHGHHSWERAEADPLAPHGLAFFYVGPDPQPGGGYRWRVRTATRLFLDGPEVADLPRLLWEQGRIADGYRRAGHLDARTQLANRVEAMTPAARYYGVGVSTLDLPDRPWVQQRRAGTGYDVMGRCYALLADGTWLLLQRGMPGQFSALRIWSSQTLDAELAQSMRRWNWGHHLPELTDVETRDIWYQLQALHGVLSEANHPGADHDR